jgi:hypothetical protein
MSPVSSTFHPTAGIIQHRSISKKKLPSIDKKSSACLQELNGSRHAPFLLPLSPGRHFAETAHSPFAPFQRG